MFTTIPDTPDAKLEALHARVNITMQMQQKCLHQAAAASILYFELHWKSLMDGGGGADGFPEGSDTEKKLFFLKKKSSAL